MSRSGSVAALLGDPELRVQAVAPSGDCFYEAIGLALASVGEGVGQVEEGETATVALRRFVMRVTQLGTAFHITLLRMVADAVDQEVFDNFTAFHLAGDCLLKRVQVFLFFLGLADFSFMKRIRSVNDLKDRLLVEKFRYIKKYIFDISKKYFDIQVSGKGGAGAGHCMWANEWEIGVVCRLCLKLTSVTTYPR